MSERARRLFSTEQKIAILAHAAATNRNRRAAAADHGDSHVAAPKLRRRGSQRAGPSRRRRIS